MPGPMGCARCRDIGNTLVPPQPNLKAASCANSSPNPNIMPLINGSSRLMAAPRSIDQTVGDLYRTRCGDEDEGGEVDMSSPAEYCSLSECIVTPDSASGCVSSADMADLLCEGYLERWMESSALEIIYFTCYASCRGCRDSRS